MIQDVGLWRRIVNGYPYKSIQELGVANKEEAFTATKQAIYCYIHGNNPDDYDAIGEEGIRTLQAMKNIIANSQNSSETKLSSTITINKNISEWKQDEIDKNYVSKTYSVFAKSNISNYKITISKEGSDNLGGIKLTDENNNEKSEFKPSEKFKILVPIKNMQEKGTILINAKAQVETKPILYGLAPDSSYQDYALTAATYEDGTGNANDEYQKNDWSLEHVHAQNAEGILNSTESMLAWIDEHLSSFRTFVDHEENDRYSRIIKMLEDFENAICHKDSNVVLLVESHAALFRFLIKDDDEYSSAVKNRKLKSKVTISLAFIFC